ncbi:MAG: heavy-metal-associated domain-containing protein, partial [Deltaproteobacteria bacterium]|nr:heavy-metal-associated domain-containing protein [Deltaproteobacteria bacterium]
MGEQKKNNITLKVGGMSCASCVAHIEEALKDLKGVSRAQVNLAAQKTYVEYDPA